MEPRKRYSVCWGLRAAPLPGSAPVKSHRPDTRGGSEAKPRLVPRGALGGYSLSKSSGSGICDVPFPFPACALQRLLPAQAGLRLLLVPPLRRLRLGWEVGGGRWGVSSRCSSF